MKSFATSICPIKKSSRLEYEALGGSPAWRTIPQPISKRFLSGVITGLRHGDPAQKNTRVIPAPSQCHPSGIPAPSPRGGPSPNRSHNGFFPVS